MKHSVLFCSSLLIIMSFSSSAEDILKRRNTSPELTCTNGPTQVKEQSKFHLIFGDYTEEGGTLKIISRKPLKIQVYAEIYNGERSDVTEHLVKKALISNIYRAFAFSDTNKITVTSSPNEISIVDSIKKENHLKFPSYTITKTREQALSDLRKYTNVKSFDSLFEKNQICIFSLAANQFLYDDQGGIGITAFFEHIKK